MYLLLVIASMCAVYTILFFLFPYFFENKKVQITKTSIKSFLVIIVVTLATFFLSYSIPNLWWGNRILHSLTGGFTAFLVCFLAARDSHVAITKFQFVLFSFMVVTSLGVANEIFEFIGQNYFGFLFAPTINDTWLDLISNTIGIAIASLCFVPLLRRSR